MANQNIYDSLAASNRQSSDNSMDVANGVIGLMGKIDERKKLQAWQQQIDATIADPSTPAQYKQILPLIRNNPSTVGQVIPALMKQQTTSPKVSIWENPQTNQVSRTPMNQPGWVEDQGLSPYQARSAANSAELTQARLGWQQSLKERTDLYAINNIYNDLNSLNQSSGGVLGQAANVQWRSQRGMHLLDTPGIAQDSVVYGLVQADLASIAQGGNPTIAAMKEADGRTLQERANGLLRTITSNPQTVDQPAVKMQLRQVFRAMDKASSSMIEQNTAGVRALYEDTPFVKENPKAFEKAVFYLGHGIKPPDLSKLPPMPPAPNDAQDGNNLSSLSDDQLQAIANGGQ